MAEFLYIPPYRQWSLFGTVTVGGSPGVVDVDHEASWLVDGREKWPLRLTTPDGQIEVENPPGDVGFVGLFHHLLDAGVIVGLTGDVSGQIVVPPWPRNGVPHNAVTLIDPTVTGVQSIIATIANSPANSSDVLIGEFIAGAPLVLEGSLRIQGHQFQERQYIGARASSLSGIPPYSDRARSRHLSGTNLCTQAGLDALKAWFDSQDGYAYPIPSVIIPNSDDLTDARLVMLAEPLTYEQVGPDTAPLFVAHLEFLELPRTRW